MKCLFLVGFLLTCPLSLTLALEYKSGKNTIALHRSMRQQVTFKKDSVGAPLRRFDPHFLIRYAETTKGYPPMLVMPFFSDLQLQELEREGISGIDLCGNSVVIVPDMFSVFRNGAKNRFSSSAPIKNIYRKNSSMVGRVFLALPRYGTVQEICSEINRRNTR